MKPYEKFIFESYSFDTEEKKILLNYSLDEELKFTETILLPDTLDFKVSRMEIEELLFALHLIGGISYYKTCLPKEIEVKSGTLTPSQAVFWNDVYENGLGEFFFKNKIDFRGLIHFPSTAPHPNPLPRGEGSHPATSNQLTSNPVLVPIGGGKDSLVTIELLKKAKIPVTLFRMGRHPIIEEEAKIAGLPLITVERHLDGQLFKLNAEGALNGHVPITAYLSILAVIIAKLSGNDSVILSSERSANEGNTELFGKEINHQWSKSLAFEKALQAYLHDIGVSVAYFSLLRPLSELHIAKLASEHPQYFPLFTSCNKNWKILTDTNRQSPITNRPWCGHCPKCAFAFTLFAAFLPKPTLLKIFGKDLFSDDSLLPLFKELLGLEGIKPFECVGTPEETEAALLMAHDRGEFEGTPVMELYLKEVRTKHKDPEDMVLSLMTPTKEHAIPERFLSLIPKPQP